jgi:3-isopropylmalate/(R)-2-methylmalate dehydratase small subunit
MGISGNVWKYGANIDTDIIIPARYLNVSDPAELAKHCMEPVDPDFPTNVRPGDIMVADANFGCGSSREHAPLAIKATGISCVVAKSFARIFYRNAINIGLPIMECAEAVEATEAGDRLVIDLASGRIENATRGTVFAAKPYPEFMLAIIRAGGLIEKVRAERAAVARPTRAGG